MTPIFGEHGLYHLLLTLPGCAFWTVFIYWLWYRLGGWRLMWIHRDGWRR